MKIVIQCSASKNPRAGFLAFGNKRVNFVSRPEHCPSQAGIVNCHPDDIIPNGKQTWREYLIDYNQRGDNHANLLPAGNLYKPSVYQELVRRYGSNKLFILSAGWGLVRSEYLLPYYDITFSNQADQCKKRKSSDHYNDFNQLTENACDTINEEVHFLGGRSYLGLFYSLLEEYKGPKVVYYRTKPDSKLNDSIKKKYYSQVGFVYREYQTTISTNWHYDCAKKILI